MEAEILGATNVAEVVAHTAQGTHGLAEAADADVLVVCLEEPYQVRFIIA